MSVQWPLLVFSVLLGVSSGVMIFAGIAELKGKFKQARFTFAILALVLVAVGGCASALHLGHPERALHILGNVNSGLSRELFAVGAMGIVTLVYAIVSKKGFDSVAKVAGIAGLIVGVVLPLVAGASYMMAARPIWDSFTLPLMYLGTGIGTGFLAAAAIAVHACPTEDAPFAVRLALAGVAVMVVSMVAYIAWIGLAPLQDETRSIVRLISGDLALAFWGGVVVVGMAVPVVLAALCVKKVEGGSVAAYLWAALACALVGGVALRVVMYLMATSVEQYIYVF